jgi:hypothetical protein
MPVRWKLFAIVNYILLLFHATVFVLALKAFFNPFSGMRHLEGAKLITLGIFIVAFNAAFNILIFHRHLPAATPAQITRLFYKISTLCYTAASVYLSYQFVPDIIEWAGSREKGPDFLFMITIAIIAPLLFFILVLQYSLLINFNRKEKFQINDQIEQIGKDKNEDQS